MHTPRRERRRRCWYLDLPPGMAARTKEAPACRETARSTGLPGQCRPLMRRGGIPQPSREGRPDRPLSLEAGGRPDVGPHRPRKTRIRTRTDPKAPYHATAPNQMVPVAPTVFCEATSKTKCCATFLRTSGLCFSPNRPSTELPRSWPPKDVHTLAPPNFRRASAPRPRRPFHHGRSHAGGATRRRRPQAAAHMSAGRRPALGDAAPPLPREAPRRGLRGLRAKRRKEMRARSRAWRRPRHRPSPRVTAEGCAHQRRKRAAPRRSGGTSPAIATILPPNPSTPRNIRSSFGRSLLCGVTHAWSHGAASRLPLQSWFVGWGGPMLDSEFTGRLCDTPKHVSERAQLKLMPKATPYLELQLSSYVCRNVFCSFTLRIRTVQRYSSSTSIGVAQIFILAGHAKIRSYWPQTCCRILPVHQPHCSATTCLPRTRRIDCGILRLTRLTQVPSRRPHTLRSQTTKCQGNSPTIYKCLCEVSLLWRLPRRRCPRFNRGRPAFDAECRTRLIVVHTMHLAIRRGHLHARMCGSRLVTLARYHVYRRQVAAMARRHARRMVALLPTSIA